MTQPIDVQVSTHPETDPDPRVLFVKAQLDKLWEDGSVVSALVEARALIHSLDRWDMDNHVLRVPRFVVRSRDRELDKCRQALLAAVLAFENYKGPVVIAVGGDVSIGSVAVPAKTVERWRLVAEGCAT